MYTCNTLKAIIAKLNYIIRTKLDWKACFIQIVHEQKHKKKSTFYLNFISQDLYVHTIRLDQHSFSDNL